jgi:iron complex transport system permease protein
MNAQQEKNQAYKRKIAIRNTGIVFAFSVLLLLSFLVSMNTGYAKLSPLDTLRTLFGGGSDTENLILFGFRLPRIVIAILVGAGLALSGCIIQGVSRNALADPGLLGINAGAGLTVILFVLFFGAQSILTVFTLPFLALIGAGVTAILIYALAYKRQTGIAPIRLILTGVAVQAGIAALTTVLVVKLDDTQFDFVAAWQAGSIWGSNWKFVLALLPWLLLLIPYVLSKARVMDVLSLGDDIACGLGAAVEKERRRLLAAAVALGSLLCGGQRQHQLRGADCAPFGAAAGGAGPQGFVSRLRLGRSGAGVRCGYDRAGDRPALRNSHRHYGCDRGRTVLFVSAHQEQTVNKGGIEYEQHCNGKSGRGL